MTKCARILVVDDDPQMLSVTSRVLQRAGYTVIEATTGNDGLRLAKERKPDLILLDVVLPDLDGLEVCRRVKADPALANSSVVLISGLRTATDSQAEGLETGADGYIARPISNRELLARVEALLRMRETERQLQAQTHALRERVKELDCLFGISALVEKPGISLEEILQGTADLIPPAWQYPEVTAAHITLDGRTFSTDNFRETTPWCQAADIIVRGERRGAVEVFYLAERPPRDEGPFLKEERRLLNGIAERMGRTIQRMWAEEALRESEATARALLNAPTDAATLIDTQGRILDVNETLAQRFAMPADELVGMSAWDLFPPDVTADRKTRIEQVIESRKPLRYEDERQGIWNDNVLYPILNPDGQVTKVAVIARDVTERKQAEEVLEQTTQLLESILEHTPTLMAYLDPQFNFIRVNRAYAAADEREPTFFPGKNHFDLYPDPENEAIFRRVVETGEPFFIYAKPFEYPEHPERGVSYWDWSLIPIKDAGGAVMALVFTLADVSERVRTGLALQRERDFSAAVLNTAGALVLVLDPQGRIVRFNRACEKLTGYTFDEVEGKPFWDLFLIPEEVEPVKAVFEQLEAGQFPNAYENHWLTRDGGRRLIAWSNTTLLGKAGGVEYIIATGIDMTERRQAELALRESEKKYRQLIELAQEGVWAIDAAARTTFVNPRMAEMLGYTMEEMQGRHLFSFMGERGVEIARRNLERRQQGIREQHDFEFLRKDGTRIYTSMETSPITDERGNYCGALALVADITERRRAEEALSTLLEISRQVALTLEVEPLLYLILDQLQMVADYDDATIFKLEDETLSALAHRGTIPQEAIAQQSFSLEQAPFGLQLIFDQQTIIIPDVHGDTPLARDFQSVAGPRLETLYGQVRSWMGVPLSIKDRVMGLLTLKHSEPDRYTPEQAGLVRAFASQAAVAIENHRLYEQAQELAALEERQRLARDLHDAVSQTLFSASLAAEVLPRLWERKPEEGQRCLEEIRHLTRGALVEMRTLLLELRPSGLLEVGLDDLLRQLVEAASSRARMPVALTIDGKCPLAPDVQVTLYRIAQEGLNNIVKHAGASRAAVSLRCVPPPSVPPSGGGVRRTGGEVELRIEDDGCGFDPQAAPADRLGLRIMHERAAAIGADIRIQSRTGHGTQLEVIWLGPS